MPILYTNPSNDSHRLGNIEYYLAHIEGWLRQISEAVNRAPRVENPPSIDQPLAQGKPASRRAKGHTPARRRKAGKGSGKK